MQSEAFSTRRLIIHSLKEIVSHPVRSVTRLFRTRNNQNPDLTESRKQFTPELQIIGLRNEIAGLLTEIADFVKYSGCNSKDYQIKWEMLVDILSKYYHLKGEKLNEPIDSIEYPRGKVILNPLVLSRNGEFISFNDLVEIVFPEKIH